MSRVVEKAARVVASYTRPRGRIIDDARAAGGVTRQAKPKRVNSQIPKITVRVSHSFNSYQAAFLPPSMTMTDITVLLGTLELENFEHKSFVPFNKLERYSSATRYTKLYGNITLSSTSKMRL